jgi:2-polyprenyl-3-methyl-5-hydroxy-6-metoxy-1,4-benzoquinol methylase
MLCKICGNSEQNTTHIGREMMLGLRDEFTYIECAQCACLQLATPPKEMSKYYPTTYYSYANPGGLASILKRQRASYARNGWNPLGALVAYFYGPDNAIRSVSRLNLRKDARLLDVGCGSGGLLSNVKRMGFKNLAGVDPFMASSTEREGIPLLKKELWEIDGEFDVVMLHHAFEHMEDPASVLECLRRILSPGGIIILRIPLCDSYAWKHYGVNWHQLDAPRHLFLHTNKSMSILAEKAELVISEVIYDSTLLQFVVSEEYVRNIAQADKNSYINDPLRSIFSWGDIRAFRRQCHQLNRDKNGDSACFYLRKPLTENHEQTS